MRALTKIVILIFLACVILVSCQKSALKDDATASGEAQVSDYIPQAGLKPAKRFVLAMSLLEQGQPYKARVELESYLEQKPKSTKSTPAREIIQHIDQPVTDYFPSEFFEVKLMSGETLSTLARDYLGDVYAFYALAKYNNIEIPSKIDAGQAIRIPRTQRTLQLKARKEAADLVAKQSPAPTDDAESVIEATQQPEGEEEGVVEAPDESEITLDHQALMLAALDKNDYVAAADNLDKLRSSKPIARDIERQAIDIYVRSARELEEGDPELAAHYYLESAKLQIKHGQPESAIPSLQRSLALDPDNSAASKIYHPLKQELADKYHREASIAYRKQELDKAIALWSRVLKIDPDHSAAKAYMAQAKELKKKLTELKDQ